MINREVISKAIVLLTKERGADKSTCPSEVARKLYPDDWRAMMKEVRDVAIELHKQGTVTIMQGGKLVDVDHLKGPIRIRLAQ